MKVLFLARHPGYFRNYESVLRSLAARGHTIHLASEREDVAGGARLVEALAAAYPGVTFGDAPSRADDDWAWVAGRLRLGLDYLRYQHPVFDSAYQLRIRARERTPGAFLLLGRIVRATGLRRLAVRLARALERAVPPDEAVIRYIERQRPDVLLLTPLIDLGSAQIDYLRAARAMRVPTALCVWSWDHLSSKALIREQPDRVFVWNETQRQEAVALHDVDASRVVVTGAQCFDQWFDRSPSRDRGAFCRLFGFDPAAPIVLYVCSALFAGSPPEPRFVTDWLRRLRSSDRAGVRDVQVLVRPHPARATEWQGVDLSDMGAAVWGSNPVDADARNDYFDSLYHSAVVVGINTSAFIEAGIVGRPVHAITTPEMAPNQAGTVHFRYLTEVEGGLLSVDHGFDEHVRRLEASLAAPPQGPKPFVRAFLRPQGLDVAATPAFVEAVERLAGAPAGPPPPAPGWLMRTAVAQLARSRTSRRLEALTLSVRERESVDHSRDEQQRKAFRRAEARAASDPARLEAIRTRAEQFELDLRRRDERRRRRWRDDRAGLTEGRPQDALPGERGHQIGEHQHHA